MCVRECLYITVCMYTYTYTNLPIYLRAYNYLLDLCVHLSDWFLFVCLFYHLSTCLHILYTVYIPPKPLSPEPLNPKLLNPKP